MSGSEKKRDNLVQVYVRPKPFVKDEVESKKRNTVLRNLTNDEIVIKSGTIEKKYNFDHVFTPAATQEEVYHVAVAPIIDYVLSGYTCTLFAYGQTGTGKTHTMIGHVAPKVDDDQDPALGMVPRAVRHIFAKIEQNRVCFNLTVSFIEIYNEEIRDLLDYENINLRVYDDRENKGATCIKGVTEVEANNVEAVFELLSIGIAQRHTAATNLNRSSSRSHTIFTIVVCTRETLDGEEIIKTGKLHLIDLAGSENIGRSGATEMRAREAGTINKSLLTLGKVIKALALKWPHIPYRESKLTRILQDSLGGKSKTSMVATFSLDPEAFDETVSTLEYAHIARNVANCPTVNINRNKTAVFKASQDEVMRLRQELNAARDGEGFYMNSATYDKLQFDIKAKEARILNVLQEVEKMESSVRAMEQRFEELDAGFQNTNLSVQEIVSEIEIHNAKKKENEEAIAEVSSGITQLSEVTNQLENVCRSSISDVNIFYDKYQEQCDNTLKNAQIADRVFAITVNSFNEIKNSSDSHFKQQESKVSKMIDHFAVIHANEKSNLSSLKRVASEMNDISEIYYVTLDHLVYDSKFDKQIVQGKLSNLYEDFQRDLSSHLSNAKQVAHKIHGDLVKYSDDIGSAVQSTEDFINRALAEDAAYFQESIYTNNNLFGYLEAEYQAMQEELLVVRNDREMHVQLIGSAHHRSGVLEQELTGTLNMKTLIEDYLRTPINCRLVPIRNIRQAIENIEVCSKPIVEITNEIFENIDKFDEVANVIQDIVNVYRNSVLSYCTKFMDHIKKAVEHNTGNVEWQAASWRHLLNEVTVTNKSAIQRSQVALKELHEMSEEEITHANDVDQFVRSIINNVDNLKAQVAQKVHAGDTPAKPAYKYPRSLH